MLEKLEAIENGFINAREARHAAAFQAFDEVKNNDRKLIEFYKQCVKKADFMKNLAEKPEDENSKKRMKRAEEKFKEWSREFDSNVDEKTFAHTLRLQMRWLGLLKQAERLVRSADDEGMNLEYELAPEVIAILKDTVAKREIYGSYFLDLRESILNSPLAQAYELDNLDIGQIPPSPIEYQSVFNSMVIAPARESKDIEGILSGWNELILFDQQFLLIGYEKKQEQKEASGEGDSKERSSKKISFEESQEFENYQKNKLPQLLWRREIDHFRAGAEAQAAKNLYNLLLNHAQHPSFRSWNNQLRRLIEQSGEKQGEQ